MSRSEFKVQGGQEGVGIQPKKAIAGQGRLLRLLQRMPASPLSKWVETIIRRGKLVQLALIILGIGFLLFEAIVANPLPLILVVVVLSFVAGWKKAGSSNS
ncbi:MAG: hypothetical protein H6964_08420 [Chromatiaceae bacterium]|nr:hypothetical protein [Gammaproteobacteria bacterium]MCB1862495.1 hypothetical protein [Gammaproteobacteria bacterium]MCB1872960.1 hypothetical protein [Gammaproteobacteria bacterium]MCB1878899.1 hypothetical protein [Gammaproteobacteria bacterium]MCP5447005.1 hypothetical protein [Chromatiaceae bacterium]